MADVLTELVIISIPFVPIMGTKGIVLSVGWWKVIRRGRGVGITRIGTFEIWGVSSNIRL